MLDSHSQRPDYDYHPIVKIHDFECPLAYSKWYSDFKCPSLWQKIEMINKFQLQGGGVNHNLYLPPFWLYAQWVQAMHSGSKKCNAQWSQAMQRTVGARNATHSGSKQCNAQWDQAMQCTVGASNAQWVQAMHSGCKQCTVGTSNAMHSGYKQCNAQWIQAMHSGCKQCNVIKGRKAG